MLLETVTGRDNSILQIDLIFRDYVNSWYKGISHNPAFPDEVSAIFKNILNDQFQFDVI